MDPLEAVFVFCFVFGLAMSGLSFLLGSLHLPGFGHHGGGHDLGGHGHGGAGHAIGGHGHGDVDVHLAHGGHGAAAHGPDTGDPSDAGEQAARSGPSPVNVNTATAFMAFFGGIGYLLYKTFGVMPAVALVVAVLAGLAGGSVVFLFLVRVLLANQRFLDPSDYRLEGAVGQVSVPIRADGIGEIILAMGGTRRSEGARSATGEAISAGTEVVIVRYERGLAYVEPWKSYAGEA